MTQINNNISRAKIRSADISSRLPHIEVMDVCYTDNFTLPFQDL